MKACLALLCLGMIGVMGLLAWTAVQHQDMITANRLLWPDPWYRVLLVDAYCGFLWFWLWVAWREQSVLRGIVWFVLIMGLGNLATAGYLLWQLRRWQPEQGVAGLLLGRRGG
jgi:hypothetical protein